MSARGGTNPLIVAVVGMLAVLAVGVGAAMLIGYLVPGGQVVEKVRCIGQSPGFGLCMHPAGLGW
jgi:hypothetical protein